MSTLEKNEKKKRIEGLLTSMRYPKGEDNKWKFEDYLSDAWEILDLDGNKNLFSLEALLIEAVLNITINKRSSKTTSQKCDAYLMVLGLLKGYPHTNEDGTVYAITDRHKDYLFYSDYMELIRHTLKRTDNIDINDSQSKPRQNISHDDTRCREYLAGYLSNKQECLKCLKDGLNKHTEIITLSDGRKKRQIKLPEPCFTLKNFPILTEQESEPTQASSEEDKDSNNTVEKDIIESGDGEGGETVSPQPEPPTNPPPEPPKPKKDIKDILLIIVISILGIVTVASIIILGMCALYNKNNAEEKNSSTAEAVEDARNQKAQEITILNKDNLSSLHLGEKAYIAVETDPRELNPHELWYISSNPSVVAVKDDHDGQIKAAEQLVDGVENRSDITVKDPDSGAQDSITIFVDDQDSRASEGKGGNNSSYDGEAQ